MAQPSIASYFASRKRSAHEDIKINRAKKVLVLDSDTKDGLEVFENAAEEKSQTNILDAVEANCKLQEDEGKAILPNKIVTTNRAVSNTLRKKSKPKSSKSKPVSTQNQDIQLLLNKMKKVIEGENVVSETIVRPEIAASEIQHITPPSTPVKKIVNALDKVSDKPEGPSLKEIKRKLSRSARLAELKASMSKIQEGNKKLKEIETKVNSIPDSPKLKTFKTIELEVQTSPQKVFSPEKSYLSPKKDPSARRNLVHLFGTTKNAVSMPVSPSKQILEEVSKPALTLPYKYRYLGEMFRCIDTACQILYNRKETITFRKVKSAVEEMLKRTFLEKHLGQIIKLYPDAFDFAQEKLKVFGAGMKQERWELVLKPNIGDAEHFNLDVLLRRRRKLFNILLDKVKDYHEEFLATLDPPMVIAKDKITRWHPEFDIERLPDVEEADVPQPPETETFSTGKDVLEKARVMFNCNTRMEHALQRLRDAAKEKNELHPAEEGPKPMPESILKGIPKALLEKVRQKQAAKALLSMTRSSDREKEVQIYSRLPEIARLTRNLFVSEKKAVLPLEAVVEKLGNCYRAPLTKTEMEEHLKLISEEAPQWLEFHHIRNFDYVKVDKKYDMSLVLKHLENVAKLKSEM